MNVFFVSFFVVFCIISCALRIQLKVDSLCFAGEFMGDIALPNINYENQWQQQKLNKTFQQELEQLKQEVHYEGLQVEEEGLTDIIRKKTKLPPDTNPILSNNEPSKNDATIAVSLMRLMNVKKTNISKKNPSISILNLMPFCFALHLVAFNHLKYLSNLL